MAVHNFKQAGGSKYSARKEVIEQMRVRQAFERKLTLNLITQFSQIGDIARREYLERGSVDLTGTLIQGKILSVLESHYRAVIDEFGLRLLRNLKQESQFETLIRDYIKIFGLEAVNRIARTTRARLISVLLENEAEGLGVRAVADAIYESTRGQYSKNRSATIARTETHNAASYANHEVAKTMNIPELQKQWVSVSDDRTRGGHAAMNGTIIPMAEDFQVSSDFGPVPMARPGDSRGGAENTINCRCVLLYVTPEDDIIDE